MVEVKRWGPKVITFHLILFLPWELTSHQPTSKHWIISKIHDTVPEKMQVPPLDNLSVNLEGLRGEIYDKIARSVDFDVGGT